MKNLGLPFPMDGPRTDKRIGGKMPAFERIIRNMGRKFGAICQLMATPCGGASPSHQTAERTGQGPGASNGAQAREYRVQMPGGTPRIVPCAISPSAMRLLLLCDHIAAFSLGAVQRSRLCECHPLAISSHCPLRGGEEFGMIGRSGWGRAVPTYIFSLAGSYKSALMETRSGRQQARQPGRAARRVDHSRVACCGTVTTPPVLRLRIELQKI